MSIATALTSTDQPRLRLTGNPPEVVKTTTAAVVDRYHISDARAIGSLLSCAKQEVDLTITSPPYWNLKNYQVTNQIGFGQSYKDYLTDITKVFSQIYDHTATSGSLWIVSDTFKQDGAMRLLPFDLANNLAEVGWILQDIIIWHKDRTLPWSHQGKLRNIFEYITFFSKSKHFKYDLSRVRDIADIKDYWVKYPERYSPEGKTPARAWTFPIPRQGSWGTAANYVEHACPLPVGLVKRIVALASDPEDLVLDPFAGSGTVLAVAESMNRSFIGTDLSKKYLQLFERKVRASVTKAVDIADSTSPSKLRAAFGNRVTALRQLKLPKELLRFYNKKRRRSRCIGVWVLPAGRNNCVRVVFVFSRQRDVPASFVADMRGFCSRAPLTKYGFTVEVFTSVARTSLSPKWLPKQKMVHIYVGGKFYSYDSRRRCQDVVRLLRAGQSPFISSKYPPILSVLAVKIDPTKPEESLK